MSDLSAKFTALEDQLLASASVTDGYIDTIEEKLQLLFDTLDVMNVNNAANTRALLAAIGANSPCAPCPTPSLTVPPISEVPRTIDADACKRTQAFLHAMAEVFTVLDTMSAFSIPFAPGLITDAINQVITDLANGDETPLPSYPEAFQIVGDGINYIAGNFLVGGTLSGYFSPLVFDLQDAIYSSSNASSARDAYNSIVDASTAPSYVKPLLKDAAYTGLWSYYFDDASEPNLTGYSGTICTNLNCDILASASVSASDPSFPALNPRKCITIPDWPHMGVSLFGTTFGSAVVANEWPGGGTLTLRSGPGARFVGNAGGAVVQQLTTDVPYTIGSTVTNWFVDNVTAALGLGGDYTIEWCPPD